MDISKISFVITQYQWLPLRCLFGEARKYFPFGLPLTTHLDALTWTAASLRGVALLTMPTTAAVTLLLSVMFLTNHGCKCQEGWLVNDVYNSQQGCGEKGKNIFYELLRTQLSPVTLFLCVYTITWDINLWKPSILKL